MTIELPLFPPITMDSTASTLTVVPARLVVRGVRAKILPIPITVAVVPPITIGTFTDTASIAEASIEPEKVVLFPGILRILTCYVFFQLPFMLPILR